MTTSNKLRGHEVFEADFLAFEELDGRMMATVRILRSGTSKNRRTYPPSLVQEAVNKGIFNGLQMFTDHNRANPEPQSRGVRELVSGLESTTWNAQEQAMDGRVEFFDKGFYDYAQRAKNYMGVSINALVRGVRRTVRGEVYEDVTGWERPRSVDWVTTPAAGGAILAFEDEEDTVTEIDWSQVTPELLKQHNLVAYEAIQAEKEPDPEPEPPDASAIAKAVTEALAEERKVQEAKDQKKQSARQAVAAAFAQSGLPDITSKRVMRAFEDVEDFDAEAVGAAITEAKEELEKVGAGPRITGQGPSGSGEPPTAKPFSVHESVKAAFGIKKVAATKDEGAS